MTGCSQVSAPSVSRAHAGPIGVSGHRVTCAVHGSVRMSRATPKARARASSTFHNNCFIAQPYLITLILYNTLRPLALDAVAGRGYRAHSQCARPAITTPCTLISLTLRYLRVARTAPTYTHLHTYTVYTPAGHIWQPPISGVVVVPTRHHVRHCTLKIQCPGHS